MVRVIPFRRKREGRTDYRKRLKLLKSGKPRLVIRFTNKNIIAQMVDFDSKGDKVIFGVTSKKLSQFGWQYSKNSLPAAYLFGLYIGKLCKKQSINDFVVDFGLRKFQKKGKTSAILKALEDSGIETSHSEEIFPSDERIKGEHIANFAQYLKENKPDLYEKQFSQYLSQKIDPTKMPEVFEQVKTKIMESDI